ncbi:vanadium-dependent haloperoxidase [Membranihabitans marinus]|uniref:vanadium-dependent haloperoxidase n=1 Tax=Membranihabitans marinus TaxID=1227546 RepID=UPI001F3DFC6E|nr:vanadium-dependent haloperoxidase [Membranihabitans marinus]
MKNLIKFSSYNLILVLFSFVLVLGCKSKPFKPKHFDSEIVNSWNALIMEMAVAEDGLLTLKGVRTEAMVYVAIHDGLNSIRPVYTFYKYEGKNRKANPIATTAQAAYDISSSQFPDQLLKLNAELEKWLNTVEDGESKDLGIQLGKEVAAIILSERSDDGWNDEVEYIWQTMAPGVYAEFSEHSATPQGFVFGAGWARSKPFLLTAADQFRSPPPPDINSDTYTEAYNEVKEYGRFESQVRTIDQSHQAMWWKDFVENSHNRLARSLVSKENLNLWESARVFALLNMTIFDAYVNVFDNKFFYNHWRPYTAIRGAEMDGNDDTEADVEWDNLHKHTYAFPSYPSAHGSASTAAMTVLANTLGKGDEYPFEMTTTEVDSAGPFSGKIEMYPPTRSFNQFSEAGLEAAMSRLFLGIHFRYDSEEGHSLGEKIGNYTSHKFLKLIKPEQLPTWSNYGYEYTWL